MNMKHSLSLEPRRDPYRPDPMLAPNAPVVFSLDADEHAALIRAVELRAKLFYSARDALEVLPCRALDPGRTFELCVSREIAQVLHSLTRRETGVLQAVHERLSAHLGDFASSFGRVEPTLPTSCPLAIRRRSFTVEQHPPRATFEKWLASRSACPRSRGWER